MISVIASKIIYTLLGIIANVLLMTIPLVFGRKRWWNILFGNVNCLLGGILLTLCFVSLLIEADKDTGSNGINKIWNHIAVIFGIFISYLLPQFFDWSKSKIDFKKLFSFCWKINENIDFTHVVSEEMITEGLIHVETKPEVILFDEKKNISSLLILLLSSMTESFISSVIIGFQTNADKMSILFLVNIIGDLVQNILIGINLKNYIEFNTRYEVSIRIQIIVFFVVLSILNVIGVIIGIIFTGKNDIHTLEGRRYTQFISDILLCFNAGMFIKISMCDMIQEDISHETKDGQSFGFKKIFFVFIGCIIGVVFSLFIQYFEK